MTELEQAIAAITKATPEKNPWSVADFADDPSNAPEIDAHIAAILNAVATGQLVPRTGAPAMIQAPEMPAQIWAYPQGEQSTRGRWHNVPVLHADAAEYRRADLPPPP